MKLSRTSPSRGPKSAQVTGFYDDDTGSIQYLVADPDTRQAVLIDTVLSFDPKSAATNSDSVEDILVRAVAPCWCGCALLPTCPISVGAHRSYCDVTQARVRSKGEPAFDQL